MIATARVKNSENKTTGFIINASYTKYYDALRNIDLIDNLVSNANGIIKSKQGTLPVQRVKSINLHIYNELISEKPLDRDVQKELKNWKNNRNNYVLFLTGARQIGKTTELLKFAYKNYEQIIYINLANENELNLFKELVLSNSPSFGMINYCQKSGHEEFNNNDKTILIIDEIQESSTIYNSIRTLQSGLKCHIAVTGSYLGKTLQSKFFKPAGNVWEIEMLPLSFREFCRAFKLEEILLSIDIFGNSNKKNYIALTEKYKTYISIGGYPEVVNTYLNTKNIEMCYEVIKTIIERFTEESASHFYNDKCAVIFENVYKAAFINMIKEKKGTSNKDISDITEFVKVDTKEHVSRSEINNALVWLKYSKILGSCDLYNQGNVNELLSERRFYFMDCGIASYIATLTPISNNQVNGAIAENFVYDELYRLYKDGTRRIKGDKPCCSVYNNYELDFTIVDKQDKKYGVEVRASNSSEHKSLDIYLSKGFIDDAYLAEITNGGKGGSIKTIPIYTVGCRFPYEE